MKLQDVEVGGRYRAKVSGRMQTVRVTEIKEIAPSAWSIRGRWKKQIHAVNESTGRLIVLRSAQRLKSRVS